VTDLAKIRAARELRDRGVSLRTISAIVGIPLSTLGDRLRGLGETVTEIRCEQCGGETVAFRSDKRFCSTRCYQNWRYANKSRRAA